MAAPTRTRPGRPSFGPPAAITDFEHLVRLFSRWDGSFVQLSRGRFEGTLRAAQGHQLRGYLATVNQAIAARGRDRTREVRLILVVPRSTRCLWQGRSLDAGQIVVLDHEVESNHRTSKPADHLALSINSDAFHQAALTLTRAAPARIGWQALLPSPRAFERAHSTFLRFLTPPGPGAAGPHDSRAVEQACLAAAVEAVFPPAARPLELPPHARAALVRRADDLMRERLQTPTGEIDLCAALAVSGRTLRLAFRERFGLGPMAYYQTLRLHGARAALKAAGPGEESVAEVASRFGFGGPGKFAGYYRRLFGELPSVTAHRGPPPAPATA